MKTAVSVPDEVFEKAEALAARLGTSRSELYATALAEYVARHDESEVTDRLDAVYGELEAKVDPQLARMQRRSAGDSW